MDFGNLNFLVLLFKNNRRYLLRGLNLVAVSDGSFSLGSFTWLTVFVVDGGFRLSFTFTPRQSALLQVSAVWTCATGLSFDGRFGFTSGLCHPLRYTASLPAVFLLMFR